jgi:rfaE bifunctional protein kinase chain/domain
MNPCPITKATNGRRTRTRGGRCHAGPLLAWRGGPHLAGSTGAGGAVSREEERIGAAANVAYNMATLGAQASLLAWSGRRARPQARSPDAKHRHQHPPGPRRGLQTTVKLRVIGRQQQLLRLDFESEPDHEALASQTEAFALLPSTGCVLFSDYGKGGLAHIATMIAARASAGKPVLVDPKGSDYSRYRCHRHHPQPGRTAAGHGRLARRSQTCDKAQALRESLHLGALLLTRSEEGMTLFDAQGELHVSAQAREVFDVTGAGDTVIATWRRWWPAGLSAARRHAAGQQGGRHCGGQVRHRHRVLRGAVCMTKEHSHDPWSPARPASLAATSSRA